MELSKLFLALIFLFRGTFGATFTFANKCEYPVWAGILANEVSPSLKNTGFVLPQQTSRSFEAPAGWSARYRGRIGCKFDESGSGSCSTRDCGSGQVECNGVAAAPATLTKLTHGTSGQDFYTLTFCPSNPSVLTSLIHTHSDEPSRETTNGVGSSMSGSESGKMGLDSAPTGS